LPAFLIAACFAKISLAQEIVAGENKKAPRNRQERTKDTPLARVSCLQLAQRWLLRRNSWQRCHAVAADSLPQTASARSVIGEFLIRLAV